jgi:ubiquinone/menaquinone biosynthesis C-methylase UbiE
VRPDLSRRVREQEWMDDPSADPALLASSLTFIRRINTLLRYTHATLAQLQRWSERWPAGRPITILDVATGSADVPLAIVRWADRRKLRVSVTGIDLHAVTAQAAAAADPRISIVRGDATRLPFASGSFDYVLTSMFLHHLDEAVVVQVLREMDRVAGRGILAADLLRNDRAYRWISLFTALSNPMVKHDARASVAQAFSIDEVRELGDAAGLRYCTISRHFGHRFILGGEKV